MEKKIPVKTLYLLLIISLGLVGLGLGSTYAVFTASTEIDNPISLSSNLTYDSTILDIIEVTVGGGETVSTTLNITNSSDNNLNYVTWYMNNGKDVEVVGEDGSSYGVVASGSSSSIVVSVRNYTYENETVTIGISSSDDSVVLSSGMKQVEDVNFLMSYYEPDTITTSTNFLNSSLTREQISSITFVDNINVPSGYTSVDVSKHSNGSILMWYGAANNSGYYDVYIGSDKRKTYVDSGYYLLSCLSNCISINFNDLIEVSKVINMKRLFEDSIKLVTLDVDNWDVSNVQNMHGLFSNCKQLNNLDVSAWNTVNVTNMNAVFQICTSLESLNLSNWDVSNAQTMINMFASVAGEGTMVLTSIGDISNWNVSNVTSMASMFQNCVLLTSLDLGNWDVSNVTDMSGMFSAISTSMSLTSIGDLSNWDTSNVTTMAGMFQKCASLTSIIGINNWDVSNVTNMSYMFADCASLISLDFENWETSSVMNMLSMFRSCVNLTTIYVSDMWSVSNVTSSDYMFNGCTSLVGGAGTVHNSSYVNKDYAHIDGGTSNPGYLTKKENV